MFSMFATSISPTFPAWLNLPILSVPMFRPLFNFPAHVEYSGRGERPPLSALRSVIILVNFSQLRQFVTRHLHKDHLEITRRDVLPALLDPDEESIYTYAKYLEPLNTMQVKIDELCGEIADQIFQTWSVRLPVLSFNLHIQDLQGNSITLQGQDTVRKVLSSVRPGWFGEQDQLPPLPTITFDGPYQSYLLRLGCTGNSSEP